MECLVSQQIDQLSRLNHIQSQFPACFLGVSKCFYGKLWKKKYEHHYPTNKFQYKFDKVVVGIP